MSRATSNCASQRLDDRGGRDTSPAQARQGNVDAPFLGVAGTFVDGAPTDMVPVFGEIGQMAEIGESADHADGLIARQSHQQFLECKIGVLVRMAPECHRQGADLLDHVECGFAVLVPDHIAQDPAQQADVFHQWAFVLARATGGFCTGSWGHGGGGGLRSRGRVGHASIVLPLPITNRLPP